MGNLIVCTGKYAKTPYYVQSVFMNVYSIEELCYLFALNPFIITMDIMNKELVDWIETECDLKELADKLRPLFKKGSQVGEFVNLILRYVNYCTEEEILIVDETLKGNSGLSEFERKKRQADYLLKNKKYEIAIDEYEALLTIIPEVDGALRPVILHNIGYAYASLFMFDISARYYKRAYDISKLTDSGLQYLASLRLYLSDEKYLTYISQNSEYHDLSLKLEAKMKMATGNFEASEENRMLNALSIFKDEGNVSSYYEEIDLIISRLKDSYISMVTD